MANEEQLTLLRSGTKAWNAWKRENHLVKIDLNGADLSEANLREADLIGANLSKAILSKADLSKAILGWADLSGAILSESILNDAVLNEADLHAANLNKSMLHKANLSGANLSGANLNQSNLQQIQALGTNFQYTTFTGVCIEDWNINSNTNLDSINCEYVFLKRKYSAVTNEYEYTERRPLTGSFAPGEFTKLFQKALETVDLIFSNGIDWKAFLLSFQELQAEYGEENLSVQAIEKKSGGAFVIRLEVPPEANKADIEFREKELYQQHILLMEAQLKDKENLLNDYKKIVDDTRKDNTDLKDLIKTLADNRPTININLEAKAESNSMSESSQSKYDQRNSYNQFLDTAQPGSNPTFNQYNYTPEQRQNLVEAAKEIETLLQHLQQSYPSTTTSEKMSVVAKAVDEIERNPTLKARVIGALKAGGTEALKELVDNPLINILLASIEGWQEAE